MTRKQELFKYAGIATDKNGITKVRFTNDFSSRMEKLNKDLFTDIDFTELPDKYTKDEAIEFLLQLERYEQHHALLLKTLRKYL